MLRLSLFMLILLVTSVTAQTSRLETAYSYLERGNTWAAKSEWDKAISDFDLAIATAPDYAGAYNNRAIARYRKGDLDGALSDFDRTLQLNPRFTEAYVNRGSIRYFRGIGKARSVIIPKPSNSIRAWPKPGTIGRWRGAKKGNWRRR